MVDEKQLKEALTILDQALASVNTSRQNHQVLINALHIIYKEAVKNLDKNDKIKSE